MDFSFYACGIRNQSKTMIQMEHVHVRVEEGINAKQMQCS
jgi:hypothetical protein